MTYKQIKLWCAMLSLCLRGEYIVYVDWDILLRSTELCYFIIVYDNY